MSEKFYAAAITYLILQLLALVILTGKWRSGAWVCAGLMAMALLLMALGLARGADLSPIYVVLTLPVTITGLTLLIVGWFVMKLGHRVP